MAPKTEKRVDPEDGAAYSYDELAAYYKGKYKRTVIDAYWEETCTKKGGAKAKAKGKAKVKAAAEPKAKVKAKAKVKEAAKPKKEEEAYKCPYFMSAPRVTKKPTELNLKILNPVSYLNNYSYAQEFNSLDLDAVNKELMSLMTDSKEWWPADYGHYGPLMIRLAWHSAGTYRIWDGRGGGGTGNMRFAPLNSWPDNGNLDKARRLLWPVKKKYGKKISWGDLFILAGNASLESMGFQPFGFAGGRVDIWQSEEDIYWGSETEWLADQRHRKGKNVEGSGLQKPLGADHMGLIYVNPQGPGGKPDPLASAKHIRTTFANMAMGDEETVALIAGGHTFGKAHGAADPDKFVGPEPEAAKIEQQGFGWANKFKSGKGEFAITSGLEGAWTTEPTKWDNGYFTNLFKYEWKLTKSPAGAHQWTPKDESAKGTVPDAHNPEKKHAPVMFTTDLALKMDPAYAVISKRFHDNPDQFKEAFAKAWYKLTHRDMGPRERCLGKKVPEAQIWQDPVPKGKDLSASEVKDLKGKIMGSGLSIGQLVRTAWASASTFRGTDFRGGANGARIRLAPQKDWAANDPTELAEVLTKLEGLKGSASLADAIVLGGCAAIEEAAKKGGNAVQVAFTGGRGDASAEQTDADSFAVLEPTADGFRNYKSTPHQLVDRAHFLNLTAPEMSVLVAGLRVLDANAGGSQVGVLTKNPGTLSNDFFVNLCDMDTTWKSAKEERFVYEGRDAAGELKWKASQVDLVFGSNSELRAIAEYYACDDSKQAFATDFATAWAKVMNLDRF